MINLIYNAVTKETTEVEVPDVVYPDIPVVQEPTTDEKITDMAVQLTATQKQLDTAQDALDFILMGGM